MVSARFNHACSENGEIIFEEDGHTYRLPMMRQESGKRLSLCDYVIPTSYGRKSPFGMFAISVDKRSKAHVHGCCCPACSNQYEDMIGRTVRMTLAEAASTWLDARLKATYDGRIIKPAAGYASCPDHSIKEEILRHLPDSGRLGISLTESYAMIPESSICGFIFMHPEASYPEIRNISNSQYERYAAKRGMDTDKARIFLGHLIKSKLQ